MLTYNVFYLIICTFNIPLLSAKLENMYVATSIKSYKQNDFLVLETVHVPSEIWCSLRCLNEQRCMTFEYEDGASLCRLYEEEGHLKDMLPQQIFKMKECPDDWYSGTKSCFYVGREFVDWYEAKKTCEDEGGYLAEIDTPEDNEDIKHYFEGNTFDLSYFIGGSDEAKEGDWVWMTSGKPLGPFTNWKPGEPNNGDLANQHCLTLGLFWYRSPVWDDNVCLKNLGYVCEM